MKLSKITLGEIEVWIASPNGLGSTNILFLGSSKGLVLPLGLEEQPIDGLEGRKDIPPLNLDTPVLGSA